jgi:hypothetical protein
MCLQFGYVIFWQKDFCAKDAHKMLVKLTPGVCHIQAVYVEQHYAECRYAECQYAECLYAQCQYAEYHGAVTNTNKFNVVLMGDVPALKKYYLLIILTSADVKTI